MGAPITAYNRISDKKIRIHSNIYEPDFVVVLDETLVEDVAPTAGLKESGAIIVNTSKTPDAIRAELGDYKGKVCTIDARAISEECLGKNIPNTPMLAAIVKVSGIMDDETFINDMQTTLKQKFESKPQVVEGNMNAFKRAISEVNGL
jgi:pyruvate ferredoxin oxidoreductase gamma subunit